jgi:GNAT superfamily N-acetyltransferase
MDRVFNYWVDTYFLFRNYLLDTNIDEIIALPVGYSIRLIKSVDDRSFESLVLLWDQAYKEKPGDAKNKVRSLLLQGDVCIGAFYQNSVIGMTWSGEQAAIQRIAFANFLKKEKCAGIGHHDFVDVDHRGKGLQRALSSVRLKYAKEKGCHAYYVFVGVKNLSSIINLMRVFSEFKVVFHVKIDVPFFTFNFFPGARKEEWSQC